MITKEQAMTHRGEFWHMTAKNKDGTPVRCRVNGKCQTWKTRPADWCLPVKRGLNEYDYLRHSDAAMWCLPELWPAESELFRAQS